jgi:polyphosphate kinase
MERNLDRRVEAITPVDDEASRARLGAIVDAMLADDRRAWQLSHDDRWRRVEEIVENPSGMDTFETMMALAQAASAPTT